MSTIIDEKETAEIRVQFLDTLGRPLANADISAATVTLYDEATAGIINSRTATNILGANGGAVASDLTITAISKAWPCVVTAAGHGLLSGDLVHLASVGGMTELNGRVFHVDVIGDDTFALRSVDSRLYSAYTSGGVGQVGLLTWVMATADSPIVGSVAVGGIERHKAEIVVTYGGTKTARAVADIDVRNLQKVT